MLSAKLSDLYRLDSRWLIALVAAIAITPLIIPTYPPLTDVPGHLGRYAVQIGLARDPVLAAYIPSLRVLKEGGYEGGGAMIFLLLYDPLFVFKY